MTKTNENTTSSRSRLGSRAREILTFSNLTKLPSNLAIARNFINVLDWKAAQAEVESELQHKVALLGLANSGKSTLFNILRGQYSSAVSPREGTTKVLVRGSFGPSRSSTLQDIFPNYSKKRSTKPRLSFTCSMPPRVFVHRISTSSTSCGPPTSRW